MYNFQKFSPLENKIGLIQEEDELCPGVYHLVAKMMMNCCPEIIMQLWKSPSYRWKQDLMAKKYPAFGYFQ